MPGIAIGDDGLAQSGVRYCFAFLDVEHLHLRMQKQPRPCSEPKSTTCERTYGIDRRHLLAQSYVCPFFAFLDVDRLHLWMQKQRQPCSEPKSTTCEPIKISFHLHVFARIDPSSECFPYSALQG